MSGQRGWVVLLAIGGLAFGVGAADLPPPAKRKVDFAKDIRPLFQKRCVKCHGAETAENGLRLDERSAALDGGDAGPAWMAGESADSLLIHLVAGVDPDVIMPPDGEKLTGEQIGLLRAWIDQGAEWPEE